VYKFVYLDDGLECPKYVGTNVNIILFIYYTILHTYLLAPWSRVLLENLTDSQIAPFYGTQSFITAFTSACHLSIS
jgi:hypothetical protein